MGNIAGFQWKAYFKDDVVIEQFDEDDKEVMYKEVMDKGEKNITVFKVLDASGKDALKADLRKSTLTEGKKITKVKGKNPQLIYRRRVVRGVKGADGVIMTTPSIIKHHVGIKTDKETKILEVYLERHTDKKKTKTFKE